MDEEPKVTTINVMPDETVPLNKVYYHGVHVVLHFHKEGVVDRKWYQAYMEPDPDEEEIEDVRLDD